MEKLSVVLVLVAAVFLCGCAGPPQPGSNWRSPSTGMEFVWMPEMEIWVGKYEGTNREYREKEPEHDSAAWQGLTLNRDRQPVVWVNFDNAKAFAEWMTEKDKKALPKGYRYRLPSEDEWMIYAQCGDEREYPWGNDWSPVSGQAGNYADETARDKLGWDTYISGYADGHAVSAPVDELWVNPWGLAGVGGNVWEACASDSTGVSFGAWRGASWYDGQRAQLRCSDRRRWEHAAANNGFRLVLSH